MCALTIVFFRCKITAPRARPSPKINGSFDRIVQLNRDSIDTVLYDIKRLYNNAITLAVSCMEAQFHAKFDCSMHAQIRLFRPKVQNDFLFIFGETLFRLLRQTKASGYFVSVAAIDRNFRI